MGLQRSPERRQLYRQEARRDILDATEALLVEEGVERFSMRKLAARCGVSAPTLYHYFPDKPALLEELVRARLQVLLGDLRRVELGPDPVANMRALYAAFARFGLANPTHYRLLMTPREDQVPPPEVEEARGLLEHSLDDLERDGRLRAPIEVVRQSFWSVLHGLISLQESRPEHDWHPELVTTALDSMIRGFVRDEAAGPHEEDPQ
ncbi:MAG: TetR/AcrR family transcriptional regulator [Proteobacteria bacterium]|nr:TetR/AcrR family transcriptional regulator [Pseudomonadota bacterium]